MIAAFESVNITGAMLKIFFYSIFFITSFAKAKSSDYQNLPFLDENVKIGLGLTYSKLESSSEVGNYFLLSQANPRFESQYDTAKKDQFTQRFSLYMEQLLYRPENATLALKYKTEFYSYGLSWRPRWISDGEGFAYGFKFAGKSSAVVSEKPDPFNVAGDIATRYSGEIGVNVVWFGQTVAKLPLSIDFELLYSGTVAHNSVISFKDGIAYRFGIEFDFGKRSLLSNWNLRGFYSYEDVRTDYRNFVDKEIGFMVNKVFFF